MLVHEPSKSLVVRSREANVIASCIAKHKFLDQPNGIIAVKHGVEEVQVLRNLNIKAPSPILHYYTWPGRFKPYEHQRHTSAFMTYYRRGFILNDMGTGKTASALWGLDFLKNEELVNRVLIASPLSTITKVWRDEIFRVLMDRTAVVLHGTRQQRFDRLAAPVDFYIINHDGIAILADEIVKRTDIDAMLIDEASIYRNGQTKKYKILRDLIRKRPDMRLYLMSGTPCPNAPTDAWALAKLVNPQSVPEYFGSFRSKVMLPLGPYKWVPKKGAYEEAYRVLQPAIRYKKEDCIDLPPLVFEEREVELTDEQKAAYKQMKNHMMVELSDAKLSGEPISAVNAGDQINKLRQILCGVVKWPNQDVYEELPHSPRIDVLQECIEQAKAKVIVVVPFKGIIQSLTDELRNRGFTCGMLNGDVSPKQRDGIITDFKTSADPKVLLIHPRVAAHGLNLTEADTMIFYAPIYSNDDFQQVIERFNRPGQVHKMTVIEMGGHWLEWQIYKDRHDGVAGQESILKLFEKMVKET